MSVVVGVIYAVSGSALLFWAKPLSLRYNATKIMTPIFQAAGGLLVLGSVLQFLPLIGIKPH